jgi:type III restriction enzyme
MRCKFILARKIREKIAYIRQQERGKLYQLHLLAPDAKVEVSFENGFEFTDGMYWDQRRYRGRWRANKHFLGPEQIGAFDGADEGEEFQCAQVIDSLGGVRFWIRNVSRHPSSFWLPTATDRFYPDFVVQLDDGRLMVVEYKGGHLADTADTNEKRTIGQLWEKSSGGRCLFIVVEKEVAGRDMWAQLRAKMAGSDLVGAFRA